MEVELFRTNVNQVKDAVNLISQLTQDYPVHKINFDLEDCDHILRFEGPKIDPSKVISLLQEAGFESVLFDD